MAEVEIFSQLSVTHHQNIEPSIEEVRAGLKVGETVAEGKKKDGEREC